MNVAYLLLFTIVGLSLMAWKDNSLFRKMIFSPYQIKEGNEWYRFVSSGFIHADYPHLIFNCLTLYFFSNGLIQGLSYDMGYETKGPIIFVLIFIGGVVVSDIPSYIKYQNANIYSSLGASGGVSSVLFASILLYPSNKIYLLFIPMGIPAFLFGFLYLIYSYYMAQKSLNKINHSAHFIGSIFGLLIMVALDPSLLVSFFEQVAAWRL